MTLALSEGGEIRLISREVADRKPIAVAAPQAYSVCEATAS